MLLRQRLFSLAPHTMLRIVFVAVEECMRTFNPGDELDEIPSTVFFKSLKKSDMLGFQYLASYPFHSISSGVSEGDRNNKQLVTQVRITG